MVAHSTFRNSNPDNWPLTPSHSDSALRFPGSRAGSPVKKQKDKPPPQQVPCDATRALQRLYRILEPLRALKGLLFGYLGSPAT